MTRDERRALALEHISALGLPTGSHLPLGPRVEDVRVRPEVEVVGRALALNVVVAVGFGLPKATGLEWLKSNGVLELLTAEERTFVEFPGAERNDYRTRIEALWATCWALNKVKDLDFRRYCGAHLAEVLPDLLQLESSNRFRLSCRLRDNESLLLWEDIAYCAHWGWIERRVRASTTTNELREYVFIERRRALGWILSSVPWDDVPLDT